MTFDASRAFAEALAQHAAGRLPDAIAVLRTVIERAPRFAPARNALGALLLESGNAAEAITWLEPLAHDAPHVVAAQINLGNAYVAARRFDEGIAAYRRAIAREPHEAGNHYALGRAQQLAGDPDAAIHAYRAALARSDAHIEAWANLSAAFNFLDRYVEGVRAAEEALARAPQHAGAHFNRGVALLALGHWSEGWRAFGWRTRTALLGGRSAPSDAPVWDGGTRAGQTVLVYAEQGFGDTLQFVRYLPLVRARSMQVVLVCQRPLVRLLHAQQLADVVLPEGAALPPHDVQVSLSSLPEVLRLHTDAEVVVSDALYLHVNTPSAAARYGRPRIGLVWAGHPTHVNDVHRSIGLAPFTSLLARDEVQWVSLQAGPRSGEIESLGLTPLFERAARDPRDFAETAATVATLDAVITVDSAVAHLSGAMGVPTWLLLPRIGLDWRWMVGGPPVDGEASPWYRSVRTVRQRTPRAWDDVMATVGAALPHSVTPRAR